MEAENGVKKNKIVKSKIETIFNSISVSNLDIYLLNY